MFFFIRAANGHGDSLQQWNPNLRQTIAITKLQSGQAVGRA